MTLLFADVEGSTRLLEQLGDGYEEVHRHHRRILREQLQEAGGQEIDTQGDAFFFSFSRAKDAVAGAVSAQRALADHSWPNGIEVKVRMGLHTGEPTVAEEGYLGLDVVRAARICSAGSGGQILLSETTRALIGNSVPEGVQVRDLGRANLKDIQHERIFELSLVERHEAFPPLKVSSSDEAADDLAAQIKEKVNQQILAGFESGGAPTKLAIFGLLNLILLVAAIVVIVLIVKWALF